MQYATSFNALHLILAQMGTTPGARGGVKEGPPRRTEARRPSQGSTTVVWPPTAEGVSAGPLAADTGLVTRRPSVRTTQRRLGCDRWPKGASWCSRMR
jgi:hypothetical protein